MKRFTTLAVLVLCAALALPANAQLLGGGLLGGGLLGGLLGAPAQVQSRVIVRDQLGGSLLELTCWLLGCRVQTAIDSGVPGGSQVFLVTTYNSITNLLTNLLALPGVVDAEPDILLTQPQPAPLTNVPGLWDRTAGNYYGTVVWHGYADQPAVWQIGLPTAQLLWNDSGAGIVAVIGTGVDPTQPVLQKVLLRGYDFTANNSGATGGANQYAMAVVNQWAMAVVNNEYPPVVVNQYAMAVVNGQGASTLSQSQNADFGHGTMVAGIIHLVAPSAKILPLTAFQADGSGYLSAVLRAIYYAVQNHATVINMSFDFPTASPELQDAIAYANQHGVTCVASAGNDGQDVTVYPASYQDDVMGIASVNNLDQRSSFSNYGDGLVFAAAPGEAVITTYPGNTYAAGWGTSFSAPFISGAVALLEGMQTGVTPGQAMQIVGQSSTFAGPDLGHGVLNVANALALLSQEQHYGGN
ncbi:MAG: S8 family peptidase [Terriglobales bacterium]